MFKLKRLNVVRIAESEEQKARLIAEGFKEVVEKAKDKVIDKKVPDKKPSKK